MDHFPILILIGRPASGKSEIIDYLLHANPVERLRRFWVGKPDVLDDWDELTGANPEYLTIRSQRVPYAVFENSDDLTTNQPEQMVSRLESVLSGLWSQRTQVI